MIERRILWESRQWCHALRIISGVHSVKHFLKVFLSFDIRNWKFGVEKLRKKAQRDRYFCVFFADDIWWERCIFEEENDGISAYAATVVGSDLVDMFEAKICFKLHIIADLHDWALVEYIGCFKLLLESHSEVVSSSSAFQFWLPDSSL